MPPDQQNRDVVPALAAALEHPTFNVQTIFFLWHQVAGPLLKSVLEFRGARNADEQKLSQARLRSSGGNGAGDCAGILCSWFPAFHLLIGIG
jgi:hypothetical protein